MTRNFLMCCILLRGDVTPPPAKVRLSHSRWMPVISKIAIANVVHRDFPIKPTGNLGQRTASGERGRYDWSDNMKSSRRHASRPPIPDSLFNPRFITQWIPLRLRGVTLLVGTVVLFPVIIGVIMFDAVTHDMPKVRTPLKKALLVAWDWMRAGSGIFRARRAPGAAQFSELVHEHPSLAS